MLKLIEIFTQDDASTLTFGIVFIIFIFILKFLWSAVFIFILSVSKVSF